MLTTNDQTDAIVDPIIWTAGEFCVTLTCNSVLVLYPLYKRIFLHGADGSGYQNQLGDGPYGENGSHHMDWIPSAGGSDNNKNLANSYYLGKPDKFRVVTTTTTVTRPPGNTSEDSILGSVKAGENNGIRRTQEVRVDYGEDSSER
jgi:hypothetical protein